MPEGHRRGSAAFTTNVDSSRWGTVFDDDRLASVIVDGVVRHGRLVEFVGPSYRLGESTVPGKGARGRQRGFAKSLLACGLDRPAVASEGGRPPGARRVRVGAESTDGAGRASRCWPRAEPDCLDSGIPF